MVHVLSRVSRCQQIVKRHDTEEWKHCWAEHDVEHELEEVFHVVLAHTIIDPGAVMVHFEYAEAALTAVVGACRFPSLFAFALLTVLHVHVFALERGSHAFTDAAWVGKGRAQMAEVRQKAKAIEGEEVKEAL